MKKLKRVIKRSRYKERNASLSSSSASSSSSSKSSSSASSRAFTPSPDPQDNREILEVDSCADLPDMETVNNVAESHINEELDIEISNTQTPNDEKSIFDPDEANNGAEILDMLGADPSVITDQGPDINKEVANRFAHIATSGLSKEVRRDLLNKYLVPANCSVAAPQLNAEIKSALNEVVIKRDKAIEARQKQMAAGISLLGRLISDQLNNQEKTHTLVKDLMDLGRILCYIQHGESNARRNFALYSVKKDLKDQLSLTKIDKYLFGENLFETLKAAKAISKSGTDLKRDQQPKKSKTSSARTSGTNLNWKRPVARRQPTGPPPPPPRHQLPATVSSIQPRGKLPPAFTPRYNQTRSH